MPMNNQLKLSCIQTADWLNMSDDTPEALVIVYINHHTYNKVNTLLTQIYSLEIGSVPSPAKWRRQVVPGGARRRRAQGSQSPTFGACTSHRGISTPDGYMVSSTENGPTMEPARPQPS